MDTRPIGEVHVHPAQLAALRQAGLVYDAQLYDPQIDGDAPPDPKWRTFHHQSVIVSPYLPEEGLFLRFSKITKEAAKTEAGDARRREQLKKYRENHKS